MALKNSSDPKSLFSQSWYRVSDIKPRLRGHTQFHRHIYREREWFILQDASTGRFHRFSRETYAVIGLMDGKRSMESIWNAACVALGDDMPTQDEVINVLSYLHQSDLLQSEIPSDIKDLGQRSRQEKRRKWLSRLKSPAAINLPLWDPDSFLEKTFFLVRPFFTRTAMAFWCFCIIFAIILLGMHWRELASNVTDRVLSTENLVLLAFIYPVSRLLHELGHAYAVKKWGGEVHEMGIMLIAFIPLPYVDASWSSAFPQKMSRMVVGAAGIIVDLFLAAFAIIVWVFAEPGAVRAVAYNLIFVSGLSTLLLNGNPLIRFDSYYILVDFLEIPNMAERANKYLGYLIQRYILRVEEVISPIQAQGEKFWLAIYSVVSFIYRIFISIVIFLFIAGKFFGIGVIFAIWGAVTMIIVPLVKLGRRLTGEMRRSLPRISAITASIAVPVIAFAVFFPLPSFTVTQGVVWVPEESQVYSGVNGFVVKVLARPGSPVATGDPLIYCDSPDIKAEMAVLEANVREVEARLRVSLATDRTETQILRDEMARVQAKLARVQERMSEMIVRSPANGVFVMPQYEDWPGKFVRRGLPIAYVVDFSRTFVRIVVTQADVEHIRHRTRKVEARLVENISTIVPAAIRREVPAASKELPSLALSVQGGGAVALDPKETRNPQAFERLFHFDIDIAGTRARGIGERVYVRFEHTPEPLTARWYRDIRRLLLRRFNV